MLEHLRRGPSGQYLDEFAMALNRHGYRPAMRAGRVKALLRVGSATDLDGRFIAVNAAYCALTACSATPAPFVEHGTNEQRHGGATSPRDRLAPP